MGGRTYVPVCSFVSTLIIPSSLPRKVNSTYDPRFLFPHPTYSYLPPIILHASEEEALRGSAGIEFELCLGGDREGMQGGRQGGQLEAHREKMYLRLGACHIIYLHLGCFSKARSAFSARHPPSLPKHPSPFRSSILPIECDALECSLEGREETSREMHRLERALLRVSGALYRDVAPCARTRGPCNFEIRTTHRRNDASNVESHTTDRHAGVPAFELELSSFAPGGGKVAP
jgi:hypothetical protein